MTEQLHLDNMMTKTQQAIDISDKRMNDLDKISTVYQLFEPGL